MMAYIGVPHNFHYLQIIANALECFYQKDYVLVSEGRLTHEQTISFRLAMYLAQQLEPLNSSLYVDCEYHGDVNQEHLKKLINGKDIRPDIIYHDRNLRNEFCIEMKIGSIRPYDYVKVFGLISVYGYQEGYCISNIGKKYVTIDAMSEENGTNTQRYRFKYDFVSNELRV